MGKPKGAKTANIKGKKEKKNKRPSKRWELYKQGNRKFCPKCGAGIFLADMGNRWYCGQCHYVEYKAK